MGIDALSSPIAGKGRDPDERSVDVTDQRSRMGTANRARGAKTGVKGRAAELCRFVAARTLRTTRRALGRWQPATIVAYHSIDACLAPLAISPDSLRKQLSMIREKYNTAHLTEVVDLLPARAATRQCVMITFDDGYLDFLDLAYPIRLPLA